MKKLLLSVVIILVFILTGITIIKGIQIGNWKILGLLQIKDENNQLDEKIKEATKLASADYEKKMNDLNDEIKKLETEKTNYEDMVTVSTESQIEAANQSYDYLIDFLWIRVENHAKEEGVKMKMELTKSSTGAEGIYNLNFTATGTYIGIAEFITHIEDDTKLGFKIEEFKMKTSSNSTASTSNTTTVENTGNVVEATFVCKDVSIEGISSSIVETPKTQTDNTQTQENK